jgi:hypothetical protein
VVEIGNGPSRVRIYMLRAELIPYEISELRS